MPGGNFRPDFISLIQEYNPSSLRFMDSQSTNTSMLGEWSDRMPVDAIVYYGSQFWPDHKVGAITGTDNYVASSYTGMPGSYTNGEFIHGYFENNNTSTTVTIDVGGKGTKPVLNYYQALPVTTGTNKDTQNSFIGRYLYTII